MISRGHVTRKEEGSVFAARLYVYAIKYKNIGYFVVKGIAITGLNNLKSEQFVF